MIIKKNDTVKVIAGDSRGKVGKVLRVFRDKNRVIVEGVNIVHRHRKPSQINPQGSISMMEAPIHASDVMLMDPKTNEPTRIGKQAVLNEKTGKTQYVRVSLKSGEMLH